MNKAAEAINAVANGTLRGGVILEKVKGPLSTGHLDLRSTNPDDNPAVTFNYFKEPEDLERCVQGMNTVIDVINSDAFSKFRYGSMPVQALINLMVSLPVNLRRRHATAATCYRCNFPGTILFRHCHDHLALSWRLPSWFGCRS